MNINKKKYILNDITSNQNYLTKENEKKKNDPKYILIDCFFYTFYMKIEDYEKYKIIPKDKYKHLRKI
jgi:hypothetical protein